MRIFLAAFGFALATFGAVAADIPATKTAPPQYHEIVEGNPNAKVTVMEFASVTCPHCARFNNEAYPELKKRYIDTGKITLIYRDLPTPPQNLAAVGAMLARCAPQGKGRDLLDLMFKNQQEWIKSPNEKLRAYAATVGMTNADVDACLASTAIVQEMRAAVERAIKVYKIHATPTFYVGNDMIETVTLKPLADLIDQHLTKAK